MFEHKTFYAIRARTKTDGPAAALEPQSRRPKTSPSKLTDEVKQHALSVRAALESSGLDHGPISVHDKMLAMGLPGGALGRVLGPYLPSSRPRAARAA